MRERALQAVLVLVGLLFLAGLYPLVFWHPGPAEAMLGIVYVTLGAFLVMAAWNPRAHRSLIAFTAWSSLTHGGLMAWQAWRGDIMRADLFRAAIPLFVIWIALLILAPPKESEATRAADFRAKGVLS